MPSSYSIKWINSIGAVEQPAWNRLAQALKTPILEWEWLHQMEASGSVAPKTGWLPCHLTVHSGKQLVAAAALYVKSHSEGEFVFDYLWADVAAQLGIKYYPKLIGMSPATPSVGYRFLIDPDEDEQQMTTMMLAAIDQLCRHNDLSGCSFHFVDPDWQPQMEQRGFMSWKHQNYSWQNRDYGSFDDYLQIFNKNQRHNIRRERKAIHNQGVTMKALTGEAIPRSYFSLMYSLYERTNDQFGPWGAKYLTRKFFEGLYDDYRHRLLFMAAFREEDLELPVAMSFLITKGDLLIGRYWGSFEWIKALHFNACYYGPIEWAIANGITIFDPGIGSTHKIRRGFHAVSNFSLHRFYEPRLQKLMELHIDEINRLGQEQIDALNAGLPYTRSHQVLKNLSSEI